MQIIFVRHGETDENVARKYLGHTDVTLNETGKQQVSRFSQVMKESCKIDISAIYTSDLIRCQETANIIATSLNLEHAPTLAPPLRELNFGNWECFTYEQIMADDPIMATKWYDNPFEIAPTNGETLIQLGARFDTWFEQLLHQTDIDEKIMIVCHGGPIRWFTSKWLLGDEKQYWHVEGIKHGCGLIVGYNKNEKQFTEVKYI
ncbi:histidine phosphatase family protein [Bacillus marasmi]|uniref:histidine phosphatase family protein n=1 Tax=Bacillus marasmi TaxID=1926279 RepID=UPI0011C873E4|nr:histidine phosphatase family protein [Bacillus marasmi]